ncbi:hypothetical protein P7C70_g6561, partial [Phenoliferia sp. Uapishka_3]
MSHSDSHLSPRLPAELQRYILQLASQRSPLGTSIPSSHFRSTTLRNGALVSKSWREFAQYELFAADRLILEHPHCVEKLLAVLANDGSGRLAGMITRLCVLGGGMGGFDNSGTAYRLEELQLACPSLEELELSRLVCSLDALKSSNSESTARTPFRFLCTLPYVFIPALRYLELQDITLLPSDGVSASDPSPLLFPSLSGLSISRLWAGTEISNLLSPITLPHLQTLFMKGLGGDNTAYTSIPTFQSLTALRLDGMMWGLLQAASLDLAPLSNLRNLGMYTADSAEAALRSLREPLDRLDIVSNISLESAMPYFVRVTQTRINCLGPDTVVTIFIEGGFKVVMIGGDWREPLVSESDDMIACGGGIVEMKRYS